MSSQIQPDPQEQLQAVRTNNSGVTLDEDNILFTELSLELGFPFIVARCENCNANLSFHEGVVICLNACHLTSESRQRFSDDLQLSRNKIANAAVKATQEIPETDLPDRPVPNGYVGIGKDGSVDIDLNVNDDLHIFVTDPYDSASVVLQNTELPKLIQALQHMDDYINPNDSGTVMRGIEAMIVEGYAKLPDNELIDWYEPVAEAVESIRLPITIEELQSLMDELASNPPNRALAMIALNKATIAINSAMAILELNKRLSKGTHHGED